MRQITDLEFAARPKWSPDGSQIAFEAFIGHSREIYVANADGTSRFQVSRPRLGADMFLGGWSPDGKRIVYMEAVDTSVAKSVPVIATLNLVGREEGGWAKEGETVGPSAGATDASEHRSLLRRWEVHPFCRKTR